LNSLRRPFQGRALPMSYLGTGTTQDFTEKKPQGKAKTDRPFALTPQIPKGNCIEAVNAR
jgi:hypothetical protein